MMSGKNGSKVRPPMMSLALVRSWTAGKNSADRQVSSKPLAMAGCQTARAPGWALSRAFMPAVIAPCTCRRRATMCGTVPTVAIIDGVRIEFYFDEHPPPHFHARYAEFIARVDIQSHEVIKGSLPLPQLQSVPEWAAPRREQLLAVWDACVAGRNPGRIG